MQNPRLASRYAKSLIDLSIEKDQFEKVYSDMQFLDKVVKESRDFTIMLRSPVIHADKKNKVIDLITSGKISKLTEAFTHLLVTKGREGFLPEIIKSFIQQYKRKKDIHTIKLTTATELSESVKNTIIARVRKTSDMQNIEVETKVDPAIIGGFILQTGDKLVDASISYELKEIEREFENNDFIYKIR
ncbi:MAG: ATP synthase F1 subunit delta [Flavisolibacter sp.]